MIGHNILHPLFIMNFNIELLKKKDPTNQSWFGILLSQEILDGRVIDVKDVSTYDLQVYGPTPFSPRDSQSSCQSAEQGDYKRLIYLYSLATQTLTMIRLEND
jgi:hypothetical protein